MLIHTLSHTFTHAYASTHTFASGQTEVWADKTDRQRYGHTRQTDRGMGRQDGQTKEWTDKTGRQMCRQT